ncbi:MAG TPA: 50S ribosomal protein L23 [Candidatus Nanoarchaeia archaeon]|nr:50S ribosomal protein L23 [Candidatus Nanoarchaeia archaeon]
MAKKTLQKKGKQGAASVETSFDPYAVIKAPLSTEKNIRQIESDNKIVFSVSPSATKADVKKAIEELYNVKVVKVNMDNSFTGVKKAYVKLSPANLASDLSADLGLI